MELRDFISPVIVSAVSLIGIWVQIKISRNSLENDRDTTPPALSQLEKISVVMKDSEKYPDGIKKILYSKDVFYTFKGLLDRVNIENKVLGLGVHNLEVLEVLISTPIGKGLGRYPSPLWNISRYRKNLTLLFWVLRIIIVLLFLLNIFSALFIVYVSGKYMETLPLVASIFLTITPAILCVFIIISIHKYSAKYYQENNYKLLENNIIFRNSYYALRDIYLIKNNIELEETGEEEKERNAFRETGEYKKWKKDMDEKGFNWGSWNYGLSIDWDNNPKKDNDTKKDSSIEYYI
ncbi:hypothetical protein [Rothia dentocariosa]|uniref:hypothetical protein n=1 Tax=Rothia dentocariosa TaxID=2047 RepID=UPI0028808E7D|nr:hypothetical protein [Rothia dentocariosa]